ncbi:MAG: GRAM domain-containing protein [Bacteroidales bacterium]
MKRLNWKQRLLIAALTMVVYGLIAVPVGIARGYEEIKDLLLQVVLFGVLFGLGFPFLMELLAPMLLAGIKTPELREGEKIIFEEGANLFRSRMNAVGGKLVLTDKRLIFSPHRYNLQRGQESIDLKDIKEIVPRKTAKIADNGLRVITLDNAEYDFTVNNREEWIRQLYRFIPR